MIPAIYPVGDHLTCPVSSLLKSGSRAQPAQIMAQTLPYPQAAAKSVAHPTQNNVFCSVVQAIQSHLQQGQSPYIHITHAVPQQFSLSDLPSSPSSTPRLQAPGDDYFSSTVFASAAVVQTYHDFRGSTNTGAAQPPSPVVPPNTVNISVLERYLPPSSAQEYKDLTRPSRPSFLMDRMCELSSNGGSLILIYPTKKGAGTFRNQYLGPILDPLLRQIVVVNGLSADFGRYLGKFSSASQMDDFSTMKTKIADLCHAMSSHTSRFRLVDAGKSNMYFDRSSWAEWYIHQERPRIKEAINLYWQNGTATKPQGPTGYNCGEKEVSASMLYNSILEGIRTRSYESEPQDGIELGVFVIRRSR